MSDICQENALFILDNQFSQYRVSQNKSFQIVTPSEFTYLLTLFMDFLCGIDI